MKEMKRDVLCIPGRILTARSIEASSSDDGSTVNTCVSASSPSHLLVSDISLSFWGGIDPLTGIVIDQGHPLCGQSVSNKTKHHVERPDVQKTYKNTSVTAATDTPSSSTMLCLPSGRGSCTASQVLLELLLNGLAPQTIVLRDADGLVAVGALIAEEIFGVADIDIICVGTHGYQQLLDHALPNSGNDENDDCVRKEDLFKFGGLDRATGTLVIGKSPERVQEELLKLANGSGKNKLHTQTSERHQFTGETSCLDQDDIVKSDELCRSLHLNDEERRMLAHSKSDAERMALRIIFRYARILMHSEVEEGNESNRVSPLYKYIHVRNAHIDGCTFIGPGGLQFVQRLVAAGGKVAVPTTLNSVSADRRQWQALGVPADYAQNSIALGDAYLALGCQPSFTCAPYLLKSLQTSASSSKVTLGSSAVAGQDWVWGESNAVVYANSVMGAHTEKTADYLDICSAITGIVPRAGVHLAENRKPRIVLDATGLFQDLLETLPSAATSSASTRTSTTIDLDVLAPVLGHLCGTLSNGKVPLLIGLESNKWIVDSLDKEHHLKSFCAAFGTTGTSPLIHIAGVTPEALDDEVVQGWIDDCRLQRDTDNTAVVSLTLNGLEQAFRELDHDRGRVPKIDLIALGNPHLSIPECEYLVKLIRERTDDLGTTRKHDDVRLVACISRELYQRADDAGLVKVLRDFGMEFISDTCWCMLLDPPLIPSPPLKGEKERATLTNSGKYAHYAPGLTSRPVRFASTANCIEAAISGSYYPPPLSFDGDRFQTTSTARTTIPSWLAARQRSIGGKMQRRSMTTRTPAIRVSTRPLGSQRLFLFRSLRVLIAKR